VRNLLENRIGKEIDIHCEGVSLTGTVARIDGNVVYLEKDDVICCVNIDKIVVVWESREKKSSPPGFIGQQSRER
jgi:hypothetical protein